MPLEDDKAQRRARIEALLAETRQLRQRSRTAVARARELTDRARQLEAEIEEQRSGDGFRQDDTRLPTPADVGPAVIHRFPAGGRRKAS